jgi:hypothetical protein
MTEEYNTFEKAGFDGSNIRRQNTGQKYLHYWLSRATGTYLCIFFLLIKIAVKLLPSFNFQKTATL